MSEAMADRDKRRVSDFSHVLAALETLCASLRPGDRLPTHTALMRQFGASERAVLRALDELKRNGYVVRRNGVGTFVEERPGGSASTLVAIAEPERLLDHRMLAELFRCTNLSGISLVCRPTQASAAHAPLPLVGGHPSHGYVLFHHSLAPLAKRLQDAGRRVVLVGAPPDSAVPDVPSVYGDEVHGGYLAMRHLLDLGHRRVALWGGSGVEHSPRRKGCQRALAEARHQGHAAELSELSPEIVNAWRSDPEQAARHFRAPSGPTAVSAWDDLAAVALLSVLARAGVRVPDEVSLVGYHAQPEADHVCPSLTTVDQGIAHQIQAAVRLLTCGAPPPRSHATVLLPTLVVRESTASPSR